MVVAHQSLANLNVQELREMVTGLMARMADQSQQITQRDGPASKKSRNFPHRSSVCAKAKYDLGKLVHSLRVSIRVRSQADEDVRLFASGN
jgi:hypothetical protein